LQLLHDLLPHVAVFGFLMNPNHPNSNAEMKVAEAAARSIGKAMLIFSASSESEIEAAFAKMAQQQVGALIGGSDTFLSERRETIVSLAAKYRIPAIYPHRQFVARGGMISYGVDTIYLYREAAFYADRILKGTNPANLPVQAPAKYELIINLNAARGIGLTVPPTLLARADEVIE